MPEPLDLATWPRRAHFEFFREFESPWFNVCVPLEVGPLRAAARESGVSFFAAYHYAATRAANAVEEFRYRLRGLDAVVVHAHVDCGATYLIDGQRFAFVYFPWEARFAHFNAHVERELAALRAARGGLEPRDDRDDLIHCSTLPWLAFTSISHARRLGRPDAIPKLVFGKCEPRGDGLVMPVSVEVHHAVMDGLHVARFLETLQHLFTDRHTLG